jgi:hypothetical protein
VFLCRDSNCDSLIMLMLYLLQFVSLLENSLFVQIKHVLGLFDLVLEPSLLLKQFVFAIPTDHLDLA